MLVLRYFWVNNLKKILLLFTNPERLVNEVCVLACSHNYSRTCDCNVARLIGAKRQLPFYSRVALLNSALQKPINRSRYLFCDIRKTLNYHLNI